MDHQNADRENLNNLKEIFQIIKDAKYSHKLVIGDFNLRYIDGQTYVPTFF